MKKYASFDDWLVDQPPQHGRLIARLRRLMTSVAPHLVEITKWGNGCYTKDGLPILFLHAEPDHLQLGFFAGANLNDPEGLLRGKGRYVRRIRIETSRDIDEAAFSSLIRRAVGAPAYR
jgi:hypothetical protein